MTEKLNEYRREYYEENNPSISDEEYDKLFDDLKRLEEETGYSPPDSPTKSVGYPVKSLRKTEHTIPLLSLDKTKSVEEVHNRMLYNDLVAMYKLDGLTVKLTYVDGKLKEAATRGDGFTGEVITRNARRFVNVPKTIPILQKIVIAGEAVVMRDTFDKINAELPEDERFRTPRNYASGSVRQLDDKICANRRISFYAFAPIEGFHYKTLDRTFKKMKELGFAVVPYKILTNNVEKTPTALKETANDFRASAESDNYPIDGVVFRYNDLDYGNSLGRTAHHFNYAVAYKFEDEFAISTLRDIEWTVGRTGVLTPTAVFDPVELDGTMVSRASLHNMRIISNLKLNIGDTIKIVKANMIIPQVTENLTKSGGYRMDPRCPECGEVLTRVDTDDTVQILCDNPNCPGKFIERLTYFCGKQAMNILGLSRENLKKLIASKLVRTPSDIYKIPNEPFLRIQMVGIGRKTFDNICVSIEKSRDATLEKYIVSLGIPGIGKSAAKLISDFEGGSYNNFMNHVIAGFRYEKLAGIGSVLGGAIESYFRNEENRTDAIELAAVLRFKEKAPKKKSDNRTPFSGKVMCVSGSFEGYKKEDIEYMLEDAGAEIAKSVTANTNYVVSEGLETSKVKIAQRKNIPILSLAKVKEMLGE